MISKTIFALSFVTLAFCASQFLASVSLIQLSNRAQRIDNQVLSVECPPPDENPDPVYFPDPTNCSRYYICSNGMPILLECPFPLVWDPTANSCNNPGVYHCEPTTTAAPPSTTTEEEPSTTEVITTPEELSTTEVPTTPEEELSTSEEPIQGSTTIETD